MLSRELRELGRKFPGEDCIGEALSRRGPVSTASLIAAGVRFCDSIWPAPTRLVLLAGVDIAPHGKGQPLLSASQADAFHPAGASAPTVLRILLGTQLRRLRESRGISAVAAAMAIHGSVSKISRIELGRNAVREVDVADLLDLYGITDATEREPLLKLAGRASQPGWWHHYLDVLPSWFQPYLGLEASAESLRSYDTQFVPGLLQTDEYSRAVHELGAYPREYALRKVLLRKERQQRFASGALRLWAVIDETALRRPVGTTDVMRRQLEYLLEVAGQPRVTIQIAQFGTGAWHASPASFSILRFAAADLRDVVYVEQLTSALYLEKRVDVERYAQTMDLIAATSTPPDETRQFLRAMLAEIGGRPGKTLAASQR